jgi:hypothetical protein
VLLQGVGVVYRPRRREHVERKPKPQLVVPQALFYAQVVKVRNKTGQVIEVRRTSRVRWAAPFWQVVAPVAVWRDAPDGIHGTVVWHAVGSGGAPRRRTRCLSWLRARHQGWVWVLVSLYNFVIPHKSLRQGHTPRTPVMALGLTDHVWSYREYIWLLVHTDPALTQQLETDPASAHLSPLGAA